MNTNLVAAIFLLAVSGIIWAGTTSNNPSWTGNQNICVGECYNEWKAVNGGGIADIEAAKQEALAAASPEALGETYYGQCVACHGGNAGGGIGPQLQGQTADAIVAKLTAYRAGEQRGGQSAMMWPVAKPMSDDDIGNLAAYISSL
ncbi:MAG: cytochrome C [Alphaproteobacteria bacterium]|nr:cytochrome C [Alphaproteobacteria bacterium]